MKQKFLPGQRVYIKDLSNNLSKSHFEHSMEAIVSGTYSQFYHNDDTSSYELYLLDSDNTVFNAVSWYDEEDLTLIDADIIEGFRLIEEYNLRNK